MHTRPCFNETAQSAVMQNSILCFIFASCSGAKLTIKKRELARRLKIKVQCEKYLSSFEPSPRS